MIDSAAAVELGSGIREYDGRSHEEGVTLTKAERQCLLQADVCIALQSSHKCPFVLGGPGQARRC